MREGQREVNEMEKTNLERAHERARLLLVRSVDSSSTPNERAAAANALARLCKKYGLNATKLTKKTDPNDLSIGTFFARVNKSGRACHWASMLGEACALLYGGRSAVSVCKGYYLRILFIGTNQQQESALHLYTFLKSEMDKMCRKESNGVPRPRSFANSFRVSFAGAVLERVRDINEQRKADEEALAKGGLRLYDRGVADYVQSLNMRTEKVNPKASNAEGLLSGSMAGSKVALGDSIAVPSIGCQ